MWAAYFAIGFTAGLVLSLLTNRGDKKSRRAFNAGYEVGKMSMSQANKDLRRKLTIERMSGGLYGHIRS